MPCTVDPDPHETMETYFKRIQLLTKLLCRACQIIEDNNLILEDSALNQWWHNHIENDANRLTAEYETLQKKRKRLMEDLDESGRKLRSLEEEMAEVSERLRRTL